MQAQRGHVPELDGIRGIACLSVLIAHCIVLPLLIGLPPSVPERAQLAASLPLLISGVDLFFVLSGFLIGGILIDNRDSSNFFRAFWTRRIARIFPVHYLLIATYVVAVGVRANFDLPQLDLWLLKEPLPVWSYATFTQNFQMVAHDYGGPVWLGVTWSLAIEEQFYFLFPFLVYFLSRRALICVVIAGALIAPILRAAVELKYGFWAFYVLLPCRMDPLMYGVLGAIIVRSPKLLAIGRRLRLIGDVLIVLIAYSIWTNFYVSQAAPLRADYPFLSTFVNDIRYSTFAIMSLLFILRVYFYEPGWLHWVLRTQVLVKAGLISYALYMYHQVVNGLLHGFIFNQVPRIASWPEFALAILVMAISVILAAISYIVMERPIRRLGHRIKYERAAPAAVVSRPVVVESAAPAR